ncbi:type VI secretion system Vgr family protein [Phytobacter sp. AG2a]
MSQEGLRFTLDVEGLPPRATAVVTFSLLQSLSTPFCLHAEVTSRLSGYTPAHFLEKNATFTVWQGDTPRRVLTGIVTGFDLAQNAHGQMGYALTLSPPLWRCGLRQNFRLFQQQNIADITATLLTEHGVTGRVSRFYEAHPAREFCVQYGETDLGFLSRLWAEEGIFFYDSCASGGAEQKLVLTDDVAGVATVGDLPFNPNTRTGVLTDCISEFRYRAQIRPSSVQTQDYTFKAPSWQGTFSHHPRELNGQRAYYEIFDYPGRFKDEQHGRDFARYQAEGYRQDAETATCRSNSPVLWPGRRFTLTGHPSSPLNREWQVTGSLLEGRQPQAQHGSPGEGTTLSNRLEVIPADRTWRRSPLPKPRVDGPQSAVVTGPPGEEIFCDKYGRVRVRFHPDRYHGNSEDSSCWIRVSQAWAGAGFGNLALPRVGQEVIVDFLHGDPDQPVITGRLYHDVNRAPGRLPDTKTQMTIRSKTYRGDGFNELRFEDATDQEQVYIHAQKDMDTEVLNNRTTDVKVDHTETIGNNQRISIGHDQTLTVARDRTVTVRNDQMLSVENDRRVSTGHDDGLHVANDRTVTVEGNQNHSTTGDHLSRVEGRHSLAVNGDQALKVTGASGTRARGEIVLQSDTQITLRVGGSFVVIHPGGVDIVGPKINLNSGGRPGTPVGVMLPGVMEGLEDNDENIQGEQVGENFGDCPEEENNAGYKSEGEENQDDYVFDEQFLLLDDEDNPIPFQKYKVTTSSGEIFRGLTSSEGRTQRISTYFSENLFFEYDIDDME